MNYAKAWQKLQVGQSIVIPWFESDKMGLGRPSTGATIGHGDRIYKLDPVQNGMKIARLQ